MSSGLPVEIQVKKAIAKAICLEGSLKISDLPRLGASLQEQSGSVKAQLDFERGVDRRPYLRCQLQTEVFLQCQRCMDNMPYQMEVDSQLLLVQSGSSTEQEAETAEYSDDLLRVHELIEDELILALPLVPTHENASDCAQSQVPQDYLGQEKSAERNPFAVLAQLKPNNSSTR